MSVGHEKLDVCRTVIEYVSPAHRLSETLVGQKTCDNAMMTTED